MRPPTVALAMGLVLGGCQPAHRTDVGRPAPPGTAAAHEETMDGYQVFRGDRLVLQFAPGGGALVSTAPPPPPGAPLPPPHPFLHGSAFAPEEEGTLRTLLEQSTSPEDYALRLADAGFRVERRTSSR